MRLNPIPFEALKSRWPLLAGVGVVLAIAAVVMLSGGQSKQAAARPPVPVTAAATERRDVPHMADVAGTVESLHSVVIRPQVDGILTGVLFKEGDLVTEGQVLATIDDRGLQAGLAAAKGQLARDVALLRAAEADLRRSQDLVQRGAVSQAVIDKQTAAVDQLKASVQVGQANVKTAEVNLSHTRIVSPVSGRAGIRRIDAGNLVRGNDAGGLVTVAQIDPISVVFPVPQSMLGDLRTDVTQMGGGQVEAFDRMTNAILSQGRITAFDNAVDETTGTAKIRAEFDNKSERLSPGQFVALRLRAGLTRGALVVPAIAVRPGLEGNFVFRIKNGAAERVVVSLGYADEAIAVIAKGLNEGDMVAVDGTSRLAQGTPVTIRETKPKDAADNSAPSSGGPVAAVRGGAVSQGLQ